MIGKYTVHTVAYYSSTEDRVPVTLDVAIDWDSLGKQLANKAARHKSLKATLLHKGIVAKIRKPK